MDGRNSAPLKKPWDTTVCWYLQGDPYSKVFFGGAKWISQPSTVSVAVLQSWGPEVGGFMQKWRSKPAIFLLANIQMKAKLLRRNGYIGQTQGPTHLLRLSPLTKLQKGAELPKTLHLCGKAESNPKETDFKRANQKRHLHLSDFEPNSKAQTKMREIPPVAQASGNICPVVIDPLQQIEK